ncbi:phosphatase PAP2 family protein [Clostridium sp.]|uniref:phosphatase PAP2 family protein n=1 Tax=Clostridium sp. TaxID=1506 RepID=UPI0025C66CF2|nr:phosphatase PAP2 family protein [Clostridium sp.]
MRYWFGDNMMGGWFGMMIMSIILILAFLYIVNKHGKLLDIASKNVFHRLGPSGNIYTFPSSEVLMSVVVYGFFVYMILKNSKKTWINSIIIGIYLSICFLIGLSVVYLNLQYPSDVAAGFEFGIVWLSLSIILLEIYGVLPKLEDI